MTRHAVGCLGALGRWLVPELLLHGRYLAQFVAESDNVAVQRLGQRPGNIKKVVSTAGPGLSD